MKKTTGGTQIIRYRQLANGNTAITGVTRAGKAALRRVFPGAVRVEIAKRDLAKVDRAIGKAIVEGWR